MKSFPSKAILFGEYTIITGSDALIIPVNRFSGSLRFGDGREPAAVHSMKQLEKYIKYLVSESSDFFTKILDFRRIEKDLHEGIYFDSDIPSGYGLGSSASIVAALYERYAFEPESKLKPLREIFARMESYFHGRSSGIDPLCTYTGTAIHVTPAEVISVELPDSGDDYRFLLIDSETRGETAPLVKSFRDKFRNDASYQRKIDEELTPLVNSGIQDLLRAEFAGLKSKMEEISVIQSELFSDMIPESFRHTWRELSVQGLAVPKLCGSGGGGYFLLMTDQPGKLQRIREISGLTVIPLEIRH